MSSFKLTTVSTLPALIEPKSEASNFWKKNVQPPTIYKELNSINSIDINSSNEILTTSASKISLYEVHTLEIKKTFTSNQSLYCGTFRKKNENIFASGASDGIVRIWDLKKDKPLRILDSIEQDKSTNSSGPVHRINFNGLNKIFSCSDDKSIKLWDFTENKIVCKFGLKNIAHDDYIRASHFNDKLSLYISGAYDKKVKIWDSRTPEIHTVEYKHTSSVESVTCRNFMVISASGTTIQIYDIVAGKVFRTLENIHHKTITCLHNFEGDLLTSSIDGHLKIFDINFNVAASFSYVPSQLLSCYYNGSILAAGANDGILTVNKVKSSTKKRLELNLEKFDELDHLKLNDKKNKNKIDLNLEKAFLVQSSKKKYYKPGAKHEELLKKFHHSEALTRVIKNYSNNDPEIVVNFMQELIRRDALKPALAGRNDSDLKKIIMFLMKNLNDFRFSRILLDVSLVLVKVYCDQINRSFKTKLLFKNFNACVNKEIDSLLAMSEISGQLNFLINSQIK